MHVHVKMSCLFQATDSTSHIKTFKIHIKESETPEVDLSSLRT